MPRSFKALGFVLVVMVGLWGCAKGPGAGGDSSATAAKLQKLEDEYRSAVSARDQFRQKLAAAEEQQARTAGELAQTRIRAEKVAAERDALNAQYETFRKNLKELLGTADSAVGALNLPAPPPPARPVASLSDATK